LFKTEVTVTLPAVLGFWSVVRFGKAFDQPSGSDSVLGVPWRRNSTQC